MFVKGNFRHVIAAMLLGSTLVTYIGRLNLSTAIVTMVKKHPASGVIINSTNSDVCPDLANITIAGGHDSDDRGEFDWDQTTQGMVLGSFFWSYGPGQVIAGRLGDMFGAKWLCFAAILCTGVLNLLVPVLARHSVTALLVDRFTMGVLQTSLFPASFVISSKWTPDHERSLVLSFNAIGGILGSMVAAALTGLLTKTDSLGGWPTVFYVSGAINIVFAVIWVLLVTDSPTEHRWVTQAENDYIKANNKTLNAPNNDGAKRRRPAATMPWVKVFTNPIVYAIYFTRFTMLTILSLFTLKLPTYMQQVLRLPVDTISYYTAVVGGILVVSHLAGGIISDKLIKLSSLKRTTVRKLLESVGTFATSAQLALISLTMCNQVHFLLLMVGVSLTYGMQAGGEAPIVSDLTSRFSGTVFGFGNALGMSASFIVPMVVGAILDHNIYNPRHAWYMIIYSMAAFAAAGGVVFLIFAKAEPQDWDWEEEEDEDEEKVNETKPKTYGVYQPPKDE